jgi:pilus assembly protein CpaB
MLRILVFGFLGLLLAGVAVIGFVALQPDTVPTRPAAQTTQIIAAAREVRAGSLLQPADVSVVTMEADKVPAHAMADTAEARAKLTGGMVRRPLAASEPILLEDVLRPGDRGFLAAVLAPGRRAVSVGVDAVSGTAGLIWPGDRVDVILTQTLDSPDQVAGHRVAGETVLSDVRVIAVDQQLVQGGQGASLIDTRTLNSRTITLEVTSQDAARIAVATRLGKLQVVLLSAQSEPLAASAVGEHDTIASGPVWGGDVSKALGGGAPDRNVEVKLFQGTKPVQAYRF